MPWIRAALLTVSVGLLVAPAAVAHRGPEVVRGVSGVPKHRLGLGTSTNWSGYAVTGSGATYVSGTWTQPTVKCATSETSWSSPWVGIDGDSSNTVEQTGTDSDCQGGRPTYYAWYEMYPKAAVMIPIITVHPGDSFTGQVSYGGGEFTLTLTDNTTGAAYTTVQQSAKARRSSVEWIMEGPSNGSLSDFGAVSFTSALAAFNNKPGSLGSFSAAAPITMVTGRGSARATPSTVSNGSSFGVTWNHA
jgi:hypothetical protein